MRFILLPPRQFFFFFFFPIGHTVETFTRHRHVLRCTNESFTCIKCLHATFYRHLGAIRGSSGSNAASLLTSSPPAEHRACMSVPPIYSLKAFQVVLLISFLLLRIFLIEMALTRTAEVCERRKARLSDNERRSGHTAREGASRECLMLINLLAMKNGYKWMTSHTGVPELL